MYILENHIDGSILIGEIDGVNDNVIKQLIPPLGTQLKFKKALRKLRKYISIFPIFLLYHFFFSHAYLSESRNERRQELEEHRKLLETIEHQAQQITLLITTIDIQVKYIFFLINVFF